jgi:iron complex transport system substrate-binding protein
MKKSVPFLSLLTLISGLFFLVIITNCQDKTSLDLNPRYVITSPELAEIVSALEGLEHIVGVTVECDYPEQLRSLPKVGTFGKIDIEKVISLNPTLVFIAGLEQEEIAFQLHKIGIPLVSFYPRSISNLLTTIEDIGVVLETEDKAKTLADSLKTVIDSYRRDQSAEKPKIYVEIYGNPIMSVSDSSYVGELVELAGADNIFSTLAREYSRIKAEDVIKLDPEIILLTYPGVSAEKVKNRMGWEVISACRNDRIYTVEDIDPDLILRAGPRIAEALKLLQKIL